MAVLYFIDCLSPDLISRAGHDAKTFAGVKRPHPMTLEIHYHYGAIPIAASSASRRELSRY
jgi:hypothetical protein